MNESRPAWMRTAATLVAVLVGCAAVQWWRQPGAVVERLRYLHHDRVSIWTSAAEGHLRLPLRYLTDAKLFVGAIEIGVLGAALVFVGLVLWRGKDVFGAIRRDFIGGESADNAEAGGGHGRFARHGRDLGIGLALFAGFFAVYAAVGLTLAERYAFRATDVLFENDTPRVIKDIAVFEAKHLRTHVHPLFVILLNPLGSLIASLVDSARTAAVLLNSFLSGIGVGLGYGFFRLRGGNRVVAGLLAAVFGLSASQFLFGAIPSTNSLAVCSLVCTYGLFWHSLTQRRLYLRAWTVVGILSLGVTTTNFVQTLVCFAFAAAALGRGEPMTSQEPRRGLPRVLARVLALVLLVVSFTALLAVVQNQVYRHANLFFLPSSYGGEHENATLTILTQPLTVIAQLAKHVFLVNFVAPTPNVWATMQKVFPAVTFVSSWNYSAFGLAAAALWIGLLATGLVSFLRSFRRQPSFAAGLGLCVLFNLALHCLYGVGEKNKIEFFEYTGNFTFLVLIVVATPWLDGARRPGIGRLVVLTALMAVNGGWLIARLLEVYRF